MLVVKLMVCKLLLGGFVALMALYRPVHDQVSRLVEELKIWTIMTLSAFSYDELVLLAVVLPN